MLDGRPSNTMDDDFQALILDKAEACIAKNTSAKYTPIYLERVVYMLQPPGYVKVHPSEGRFVRKLSNSLYGLPESGRCWNAELDRRLQKIGLGQSNLDLSVYFWQNKKECLFISVYADDCLMVGTSDELIDRVMKQLKEHIDVVEDFNRVNKFLGI